ALYYSTRRIGRRFDAKTVPYIGVLAAIIFAAQFVNFPVPPSSAHLVGSTLVSVIVGPWAGMLVLFLVLVVQAIYGDGGVLTLSLNFFNMGIFSCLLGWILAMTFFTAFKKKWSEKQSVLLATAAASYITTVAVAFVLGLEMLTVPGVPLQFVGVITAVHAVIGFGEAFLTYVILLYFVKARPSIVSFLQGSETSEMGQWNEVLRLTSRAVSGGN
ncbi:MAG: energy-coupling factor ABC transporter permease, partial [Candidatus Thorarchaeota archaeon]|nr:energy-coupling factor ABC transporter permease [Candidatus Thorarchaeota archaeon]